jgi:predicted cupin superfamily sugar epimerase
MKKQDVIRALALTPHFEGGYFAETFRADAATKIVTARGERLAMTAIYFMLDDTSPPVAFHSKHSDGIQSHLKGDPVTYHLIHRDGTYEKIVLGPDIENGQSLQLAVAGGTWKALELESGDYGLVSEVVSPGWELEDMIETNRQTLSALFPQHAGLISRLTHV